ncbi:hypothetical protein ALUC_10450S [Aspergillus luchuensis]|nr:hypothetical protein ALUC_10450S [Aspergillus luchuensis]
MGLLKSHPKREAITVLCWLDDGHRTQSLVSQNVIDFQVPARQPRIQQKLPLPGALSPRINSTDAIEPPLNRLCSSQTYTYYQPFSFGAWNCMTPSMIEVA